MEFRVTLQDIQKAYGILEKVVKRTTVEKSLSTSQLLGTEVFFKLENTQYTGSFKIRGAYYKIYSLNNLEKQKGVIAASAGNHAQGVARSASLQGVKATIVMPRSASLVKAEATQSYGAQVIFHGDTVDESIEYAQNKVNEEGLVFVHPFEDPYIIAGQGTIGLELLEDIPHLDSVVVPIGGGGLISGVAVAIKTLKPQCRIIGVVSSKQPGMQHLKQRKQFIYEKPRIPTIADGIAIKKPSLFMFHQFIDPLVDEIVSVTDDEIAQTIVYLMERAKTLVEGSGAVALAAAMHRHLSLGAHSVFILSGGNIDLNLIEKIIQKAQVSRGRLIEIGISVSDLPGSLSKLTYLLAQTGANIVDVRHDRVKSELALRETHIHFVLETRNHEHIILIKQKLKEQGYDILT